MKREMTEKLRQQLREANRRYYSKKREEGFVKRFVKQNEFKNIFENNENKAWQIVYDTIHCTHEVNDYVT